MEIAKLTKDGLHQTLSLPEDFPLRETEFYVKRIGRIVVLIPKDDPWEPLASSLSQFSEDFMAERPQLPAEEREPL